MIEPLKRYNNLETARGLIAHEITVLKKDFRCLSCDHFESKEGYCTYWKGHPPEEGLREGCDRWDHIPF